MGTVDSASDAHWSKTGGSKIPTEKDGVMVERYLTPRAQSGAREVERIVCHLSARIMRG